MAKLVSRTLIIATITTLFALTVVAQTSKPKAKPKPLATPPPVLTGAEIVSRSEDHIEVPTPTPTDTETRPAPGVNELSERVKKLEGSRTAQYDDKQKRMLLNLDILTRAEQRSESLRKQLFEMIEKENTVKSRLDQIDYDSRAENIERVLHLAGSMRPEEVRENRRRSLAAEKANLQALLGEIQNARTNISTSLLKADQMVDRLRLKLEKDIEDSFLKEDDPEN